MCLPGRYATVGHTAQVAAYTTGSVYQIRNCQKLTTAISTIPLLHTYLCRHSLGGGKGELVVWLDPVVTAENHTCHPT